MNHAADRLSDGKSQTGLGSPGSGPFPNEKRRTGLLGGTFNPIHYGHLELAEAVRKKLQLDRVLFIPSGDPPHKTGGTLPSAAHRLEMTRLALRDQAAFELSDIEVRRSGKSYSIDTVTELQRLHPNDRLFFIIGADAFSEFASWKEADRLLSLCDLVVVSRPGHSFLPLPDLPTLKGIDRAPLLEADRGQKDFYAVATGPGVALHFVSAPPVPISASDIRRRFAADDASERNEIKNLLPESTRSYIIANKIYNSKEHA